MGEPVQTSYLVYSPSPEKVFDALLDIRRFPEWASGLRRAEVVSAAGRPAEMRPGAELEFHLSAAGMSHRIRSAVTEVQRPRRIEWRYISGAVGRGGWLLEEAGANAVRMTLYTDYEVKPAWLDRVANRPFFRGITEDLLARSMRRFGEWLGGGVG